MISDVFDPWIVILREDKHANNLKNNESDLTNSVEYNNFDSSTPWRNGGTTLG